MFSTGQTSPWSLRAATPADTDFMARMLGEASAWRPESPSPDIATLLADPNVGHYIVGWPRAGDFGVVATNNDAGHLLGAAWCRQLRADDPGYGYIADDIPEVIIGVQRSWRNRGVGTALLDALVDQATQRRHRALSLSVEQDNPARGLYTRLGFTITSGTDRAWTMIRLLPERP